ncbi:hypothetical protein CPB84DRAFT_1397184 [Gymnopilus junonius]|uniref:Uncharacterized protein n=1 Tax=Gymnopilus junonius TaxID=109634 RepID=A0A9P5NLA3_GYMJU|nr:hypothetical protein CPB84DRAFT_1397184 [Gymnopilus junonius]
MASNDVPHFISQQANLQKRNIFVWCGLAHTISLSLREDLGVTEKRLYTWLNIVINEDLSGIRNDDSFQYRIFPVTVKAARGEILTYQISLNMPLNPLSRGSENLVKMGDYAIYAPDGSKPLQTYEFENVDNFSEKNSLITRFYPNHTQMVRTAIIMI